MEQAQTGYTTVSNLHGIFYDYDKAEVTISYKVVPDMYPPYTLSFVQFKPVLEGLLTLRRNQSGKCNIINNMNPMGGNAYGVLRSIIILNIYI